MLFSAVIKQNLLWYVSLTLAESLTQKQLKVLRWQWRVHSQRHGIDLTWISQQNH